MKRTELIKYIRSYDGSFITAHLEKYPFYDLVVIKTSIDVEKEKNKHGRLQNTHDLGRAKSNQFNG
jgi:hypothetical protein